MKGWAATLFLLSRGPLEHSGGQEEGRAAAHQGLGRGAMTYFGGWGFWLRRAAAWDLGAVALSGFLDPKEVLGSGIQKLRLGMDFITWIDRIQGPGDYNFNPKLFNGLELDGWILLIRCD